MTKSRLITALRAAMPITVVLVVALLFSIVTLMSDFLPVSRLATIADHVARFGGFTAIVATLLMYRVGRPKIRSSPHGEPEVGNWATDALAVDTNPFRQLLDGLPCHIGSADAQGRHDFANQRMLDYCGLTYSEVLRLGWLSIVHPEEREAIADIWRHGIESHQTMDFNHRLRRFDGSYRWFNARVEPFRDHTGHVVRWYGVITDIDAQQHAVAAVRESERRLQMLIDTMPGLAWCATRDGRVSYINPRLIEYTGLSLQDLRDGGWNQVVHPEDVELASRAWLHSLNTSEPYSVTKRCRGAAGGYRWHEERANPLFDEDGRVLCWYGLLLDVDDNKQIEAALRLTQNKLARASQAAAIGELSASIAHEINQPLAAVVSNGDACLHWLSAEPPNLERARRTAEYIVRDGNGAAQVVRKLRSLFSNTPPERASLDLNDAIREVVQSLRDEMYRKAVQIDLDLPVDLPPVFADRIQVQQVLANLAQNSADAMDEQTDRPKSLLIRTRIFDPATVIVQVQDHGTGISDVETVFQPFFSTKDHGLGVGLSICRSIIDAHEGNLWIAENDAQGATIAITLPVHTKLNAGD